MNKKLKKISITKPMCLFHVYTKTHTTYNLPKTLTPQSLGINSIMTRKLTARPRRNPALPITRRFNAGLHVHHKVAAAGVVVQLLAVFHPRVVDVAGARHGAVVEGVAAGVADGLAVVVVDVDVDAGVDGACLACSCDADACLGCDSQDEDGQEAVHGCCRSC